MDERSPYDVLGVHSDASDAEIHDVYRKLAKRYHPDLHPDDPLAESRFKEIAAAYEVLSHPEKRGRFDDSVAETHVAETPAPSATDFSDLLQQARARQASRAAAAQQRDVKQLGWLAWIYLLLAVPPIIFAWFEVTEIPRFAIFLLFIGLALVVMRVIHHALSPED
jgi:curved DNA-binding protein CbpA